MIEAASTPSGQPARETTPADSLSFTQFELPGLDDPNGREFRATFPQRVNWFSTINLAKHFLDWTLQKNERH